VATKNKNQKKNEKKQQEQKPIAVQPDQGFAQWVAESGGSLAISTYQAGQLFMVGWNGKQLSMLPRNFQKVMGFDILNDRLVLATRYDVISFQNNRVLAHHYFHDQPGRYDALFIPRMTWHTSEVDLHDVAITSDKVWLVNTRFSCLATLSHDTNFKPEWHPEFITDMVPEDRCHLNGLAIKDDKPAYVTALGETNSAGAWRDNKAAGGIVIDVNTNGIILRALAMPHSPRWYDNALWLLNSGAGQLLKVNPQTGDKEVVCELQGYLRGLTFIKHFAIVGLCQIRQSNVFGSMPVQNKFDKLICAVVIVDTKTGNTVGSMEFTQGCTEIYDIRFMRGITKPNILNMEKEQARQAIVVSEDIGYWIRDENVIK